MKRLCFLLLILVTQWAQADQVLVIDAQYSNVTANVQGRLEAAGHTVTVTTNTGSIPTGIGTYQQVWDLRYSAALTSAETTNYTQFITAGGFAYFVTENPGCCMSRNNSIAALVTGLGGGSTQIGPGWADNVNSNVNTTYMTNGITVNYMAVAAIVNSQGIPLISDANGNVSGMSWIGRAGALGDGILGTIVTVADTNWLAQAWGADNQTALDDIIRGIVAGTVAGTISASGNGAGATNGNTGSTPTIVSTAPGPDATTTTVTVGATTVTVSQASPAISLANGIQTVQAGNITTRSSTPTTTRTCTVPSTVNTWSDGSTTVDLGTQTCSDATSTVTSSVVTADPARTQGRYDQLAQLREVDSVTRRLLDHDPFSNTWMSIDPDTRVSIRYMDGRGSAAHNTDTTNRMYGAALERRVSGLLKVGLQGHNVDTTMNNSRDSVSQTKTHVGAFGRLKLDDKTHLHTDVNMAWNDITYVRTMPIMTTALGAQYSLANRGDTKSTDFWITNRVVHELQKGTNVYAGVRSGMTRSQAYTESGSALTALRFNYSRAGENAALTGIDVQKKVRGINLRAGAELDTSGYKQARLGLDIVSRERGALGISYVHSEMQNTSNQAVMLVGRLAL